MSIVCHHLSYAQRLRKISFDTAAGQLVGIIGANGAGKTTLLHALTGLLTPTAGTVHFAAQDIARLAPLQRRALIGFLPQNPLAHAEVTVQHFLQSGLVNLASGQRARRELERVTHLLELKHYLERPITQLSGGEQRRVQLARALLGDQPWLACDEPTASLDLHFQLHVMELLKQLAQQGKTVTAALHNLDFAARYCDQVILLDHGELLAAGEPAAVLTDANLAQAFGIKVRWLCSADGVGMVPTLLNRTD